jgi:hypothetical protein
LRWTSRGDAVGHDGRRGELGVIGREREQTSGGAAPSQDSVVTALGCDGMHRGSWTVWRVGDETRPVKTRGDHGFGSPEGGIETIWGWPRAKGTGEGRGRGRGNGARLGSCRSSRLCLVLPLKARRGGPRCRSRVGRSAPNGVVSSEGVSGGDIPMTLESTDHCEPMPAPRPVPAPGRVVSSCRV